MLSDIEFFFFATSFLKILTPASEVRVLVFWMPRNWNDKKSKIWESVSGKMEFGERPSVHVQLTVDDLTSCRVWESFEFQLLSVCRAMSLSATAELRTASGELRPMLGNFVTRGLRRRNRHQCLRSKGSRLSRVTVKSFQTNCSLASLNPLPSVWALPADMFSPLHTFTHHYYFA